MDAPQGYVPLEQVFAAAGFLLQVVLTIGAIAFSHGMLNGRVKAIEDKVKDHGDLSNAVAKMESEIESVGREIKNLREDFRRVLDEFARVRLPRQA